MVDVKYKACSRVGGNPIRLLEWKSRPEYDNTPTPRPTPRAQPKETTRAQGLPALPSARTAPKKSKTSTVKEPVGLFIFDSTSGEKIPVSSPNTSTVRAMKEELSEMWVMPIGQMRLSWNGRILRDAFTLMSYGVDDGQCLFLTRGRSETSPECAAPNTTPIYLAILFVDDSARPMLAKLHVQVRLCDRVLEVKRKLELLIGIAPGDQRLLLCGRTLANDQVLLECGITDETFTLNLMCPFGTTELSPTILERNTHLANHSSCVDREEFPVSVRETWPKGKTLRLSTTTDRRIRTLKERISALNGVDPDKMLLLYRGRELDDWLTPNFYNLEGGACIDLALVGGCAPRPIFPMMPLEPKKPPSRGWAAVKGEGSEGRGGRLRDRLRKSSKRTSTVEGQVEPPSLPSEKDDLGASRSTVEPPTAEPSMMEPSASASELECSDSIAESPVRSAQAAHAAMAAAHASLSGPAQSAVGTGFGSAQHSKLQVAAALSEEAGQVSTDEVQPTDQMLLCRVRNLLLKSCYAKTTIPDVGNVPAESTTPESSGSKIVHSSLMGPLIMDDSAGSMAQTSPAQLSGVEIARNASAEYVGGGARSQERLESVDGSGYKVTGDAPIENSGAEVAEGEPNDVADADAQAGVLDGMPLAENGDGRIAQTDEEQGLEQSRADAAALAHEQIEHLQVDQVREEDLEKVGEIDVSVVEQPAEELLASEQPAEFAQDEQPAEAEQSAEDLEKDAELAQGEQPAEELSAVDQPMEDQQPSDDTLSGANAGQPDGEPADDAHGQIDDVVLDEVLPKASVEVEADAEV